MAKLTISGLKELGLDLEKILQIPDAVKSEMLTAGANIIAEEQRRQAPVATGKLRESITVKKPRATADGGICDITFEGVHGITKKRNVQTTNAALAYITEYGIADRNIAPNPFIRRSNEAAANEAAAAEMRVYDNWLKTNNL